MLYGRYKPFGARVCTDHRLFFANFDSKKSFDILLIHPKFEKVRYLYNNNILKVKIYLEVFYEKLTGHNAFQLLKALFTLDQTNHELSKELNEQYTTLALLVEKSECRIYHHEWLIKLLQQRAQVSFLQYTVAQYLTQISHHKSTTFPQKNLGPFDTPNSLL